MKIIEKTSQDFCNGIEAIRFDYTTGTAYLSTAFSSETDSLFAKITNRGNMSVPISFQEICRFYDDRDPTVIASTDDWADQGGQTSYQSDQAFRIACKQFRKHHVWLSYGIITNHCHPTTWQPIQTQLDSGYVEACPHSRTHPAGLYTDPQSQIAGSKQDIIDNFKWSISALA